MSISSSKWPTLATIARCLSPSRCSGVTTRVFPVPVMRMSIWPSTDSRRRDLESVHRRLQCADRVDLADDDPRTLAAKRLSRAFADVAVADDEGDLAADQHVGGAVQPVRKRVADAIGVVELRLRDRVVHVDRGKEQAPRSTEFVEAVDARGRLFGHPDDVFRHAGEALRVAARSSHEGSRGRCGTRRSRRRWRRGSRPSASNSTPLWTRRVASPPSSRIRFGPVEALCRPVEDAVGQRQYSSSVSPFKANTGTPAGSSTRAVGPDDDRCGRFVLRREDVAARPPDLRAEGDERLDEHGGLHGHVQRAGDPRAARGAGWVRTPRAGP